MNRIFRTIAVCVLILACLAGCAHGKIPQVFNQPPKEPYEVIQTVETTVHWGHLQWLWFWWHYLPWYPSVYKVHDKALIKKAQKMDADAIINVEYLEKRSGARGEAIRYKSVRSFPNA